MTLEVSPVQCHQKKDFSVLAVPPPPTDLNPELTDFCSCFQIILAITEFYDDENESQSFENKIEKESELKWFVQAFQMAQRIAIKKEKQNKKKKRVYTKNSKRTLKHCTQELARMESKGFLPLDKFLKLKDKSNNTNTLTPELDNMVNTTNLPQEEGSDELEEIMSVQDTCIHNSIVSTSNAESEESLPQRDVWPHFRCLACTKSETISLGKVCILLAF